MPLAPIDKDGTAIYYEDTGAPETADVYTTFVLVHGLGVNGGIFRKTFAHAKQHKIRIIAMNLRDYFGSTPYTADELLAFSSPDISVQAEMFRKWAREVALFLVFVAEQLGVPKIDTSTSPKPSGGIVLVPWSLSNACFLSMFGDPETLDKNMRVALTPYLRKVIMYDSACVMHGILPEGPESPLTNASLTPLERGKEFWRWVSAYFPAVANVESITLDTLKRQTSPLSSPRPSHESVTAADLPSIADPTVVLRSGSIMGVSPEIYLKNFRRTFLDAAVFYEDMEVVALWCNQSTWFCKWGARTLADIQAEKPAAGQKKRKLSIVKVDKANHFLHWERPEEFVRILVENS